MKYEWRKQNKELYIPKQKPVIIRVPTLHYFTIEGTGNPQNDCFLQCVETLYTLSYAIRMSPKQGLAPEGYYEYTVFPLEGIWDLDEEGRALSYLDKNHFVYTLMIRQPDFITEELFSYAVESVKKKKPHLPAEKVKLQEIEEGLCVQMMHHGSYDDEPQSFEIMEQFCNEQGLTRLSKVHKEVYISDARKVAPEKLKTVLRFKVKEKK